ncbi:MAG TPA: helix-turn-helix transcriptional regulator, partial [Oscillospiraceae bacterium]|nr:helix-turn-helix transcriptional regulator [Oscillospiraceae bacterium]
FVLNNAERFFSAAFMILLIKLVELGAVYEPFHPAVEIGLAVLLLVPLCLCMFFSKSGDYEGAGEKTVKRFDVSVWLTLFLFLSYFAIRITGFYAPAFGHPAMARLWGLPALALLLGCVLQQALLRRSVWTLCNVFFLSSILSYVMWYLKAPEAAYLFSELKEIGFLTAFYLIGCVTNKFCDFQMHKRLVLVCIAAVGLLYIGIDALHAHMLDQKIAVMTAALLFAAFLLLSPAFFQHLFFAKWSEEFRRVRMSFLSEDTPRTDAAQERTPSLDDTNLSPREKQVVLLLLQGMTLRQVAPELGLTVSTVSTYAKAIYKKLNINSRAELFLLFGGRDAAKPLNACAEEKG